MTIVDVKGMAEVVMVGGTGSNSNTTKTTTDGLAGVELTSPSSLGSAVLLPALPEVPRRVG